jgi:hypothetical protein
VPVDISNVQGQIDVTLNVAGNGAAVSGVDLLVRCPNNPTPVRVQGQTFSGNTAPNAPITLSFNTAQLNAAGNAVAFQNGACIITAQLITPAGSPAATPVNSQVTFANVDIVRANVSSARGPAADQAGNPWRGGDVTVAVTPLIYSGATPATVTVTLTGTDTDGTAISRSQTVSGPFPQNVVFPASGTGATSIDNLTVPAMVVTASTSTASNLLITNNSTPNNLLNLDTEDPAAGTYAFNTQGTANNWIGTAFAFNTTAGNGYTAGTTPPGGNDWGGVDRVTVIFEAAPINTDAGQVCASTQTGLTFTAVTSGSNLNSSQVNGVSPNGPSYCLRMREVDALQNERITFITPTFGVDRENPTLIASGGLANNSSFNVTGTDPVADAFPVAGTVAAAPGSAYTFTIRDTLSGFDATPVNYNLTRLTTGGTACVVGTGTACAMTDGPQTVAVNGTDRDASVAATGGTATEGYYTFNGRIRDQAANVGATLPTRMSLVDGTLPTVGAVFLPQGEMAGNTTVNFVASATDNLDLYLATSVLAYPTTAIRGANQQVGTPFDATLTTSLPNLTASFANFYRTLSTDPTVPGVKPTAVTVRATDAAGNVSAAGTGTTPIPPQNVGGPQPAGFTFAQTSIGVQGFAVTGPTTACTSGAACTITVTLVGPSGTFVNPFAGLNIYFQDPATNELVLLTPSPLASGAQTDNGVNRFYTYTFSTSALPAVTAATAFNVFAIGFTSAGDALRTAAPFAVTQNPPPAP